jgi:hypothetical protein
MPEIIMLTLAIMEHCKVTLNLREFPSEAVFEGNRDDNSVYYSITHSIGLMFGSGGIELKICHEGKIIASVEIDYY